MDGPEIVILSEINQMGERKISYDIAYMWNLKKHDTKWKQNQRCRKQTSGYQGEREGGINQEMGIDIHILLNIK